MPRPKDPNPKRELKIRLPAETFNRLELEAFDPRVLSSNFKVPHNAKNDLINLALMELFNKLDRRRLEENKMSTQFNALTDKTPEDMTPQERQAEILEARRLVQSGMSNPEIVQRGIELIRAHREARTGVIPKTKAKAQTKAKKSAKVNNLSMDELFGL